MTDILTITPNPAVDLSTSVERIIPTQKLRGTSQRRDPGGGGVNVARVITRLGGEVRAIYPVGGAMGALLRKLLDSEGVASQTFGIADETRRLGRKTSGWCTRADERPHVTLPLRNRIENGSASRTGMFLSLLSSLHSDAPPFKTFGENKLYDSDLAQRLQDGLTSIHRDMPTFKFSRSDASAAINYLKSIQDHGKSTP
jgi:hypothetical protein